MNIGNNQGKGQSAIEYLTTYGWMLLVVAIVGGAIFTTVQDSAQIQNISGLNNADVQVSDYGLNSEGLQLNLRAAASDQVEIKKVEVTDPESGVSADISPSKFISVGDTSRTKLENIRTTDTSDEYEMEINYDTGGLGDLTAEGTIRGSFGVFNRISLKKAKFNRSTNKLHITVKNTGDNTTDSISYTVEAKNTDYTGTLPNLDAGEKTQINVSTDKTYPLESVNLNVEGFRFIDNSSGIKCTPTKGLVGYWPFNQEQTQKSQTVDLSGYGNHGELNGGISSEPMGVGEGYSLDGEDDYIKINNSASLNVERGITLSLWYRSFQKNLDYSYILRKGSFSGSSYFWVDEGRDTIEYSPRVTSENNDWYGLFFDPYINYGELHHTAFSYDKNSSKLYAFSNGKLVDETIIDSFNIQNSSHDIIMGSGGPAGKIKGDMDEVRIYNRSLPQRQIKRLYKVRDKNWAVEGCKLTKN